MKQQLRKSLTEAFELRGTAPNTRATYESCVDRFERHFGKSASRLGRNEVREFLLHLVARGLSASTHNVYAGALYFLYGQVLGRPGVMARLRFRKQPFKLPEVLTQREVERLLEALPSPRHRAIVMLAYGAGLRIGEVCQLCVGDIDSKVGVVHIRHAKRGRARDVMLSHDYWLNFAATIVGRGPKGPSYSPAESALAARSRGRLLRRQ
ncbi:MAG: site-specific integrase [Polyangiaceae bacterium]